ncbi:MAG: hypothetical protein EA381_09135 [Planctomycetaceae bacterium]|nr:MAG: hypothetical protein EA381_09135 [Planctomycetaceae bacterium]
MNGSADATGVIWHVIESGDRWHQTLRGLGAAGWLKSPRAEHWRPGQLDGLLARLDEFANTRQVVVWEVPAAPDRFVEILAGVAGIRDRHGRVIQVAHPEGEGWTRWQWHQGGLVLQEVGVSVLLADLWSLRTIATRLG